MADETENTGAQGAEGGGATAATADAPQQATTPLRLSPPARRSDYATISGLLVAFVLIATALVIGGSPQAFFDIRSFLIVICGTLAVTTISFTMEELRQTWQATGALMVRREFMPQDTARQILDLAMAARKDGVLALQNAERQLRYNQFFFRGVQMVSDGNTGDELVRLLGQEIDSQIGRSMKAVSVLRRAAEAAPAMGLIGTLIGLVQMLAMLDDPSAIGPNMAVALLTTFYGALLGTVVFSPLAAKVELTAQSDALQKNLIMMGLASIARQENPRRLEMVLNSELPPAQKIRYFK